MPNHPVAGAFIVMGLFAVVCGCDGSASAPRAQVKQVAPRAGAMYDAVSDISSSDFSVTPIVQVPTADENSTFLADLYDFALQHFPNGTWTNFGPDSSYRKIEFVSKGRQVRLKSWHPLYETNSNVVAGSHGLTPLLGQSREAYLRGDDPTYVRQRKAFDEIEARLRKRYGP